jgi:hypothetical protein
MSEAPGTRRLRHPFRVGCDAARHRFVAIVSRGARIVQQAKSFSCSGVVVLKQHCAILRADAIGRVAQQE